MNKYLKIFLIVIISIFLLVVVDLTCIFTINRPIIAIKKVFDREDIKIPFPIRTLDFGISDRINGECVVNMILIEKR